MDSDDAVATTMRRRKGTSHHKVRISWRMRAALMTVLGIIIVLLASVRASQELPRSQRQPYSPTGQRMTLSLYSVEYWKDVSLGNHRVRLLLTAIVGPGTIAWAHVEWRLPGLMIDPQQLQLQSVSGETIELHVLRIDSESTTLLFEPLSCGSGPEEVITVGEPTSSSEETCSYLLYYLPFVRACETGPSRTCPTPYKYSIEEYACAGDYGSVVGDHACCGQGGTVDSADRICPSSIPKCQGYQFGDSWGYCVAGHKYHPPSTAWGKRSTALIAEHGWQERTPRATLVGLHARTERDAFHPMEVAATGAEVAGVRAWGRALAVWPEDRRRPIRMSHTLPLPWIVTGAAPVNGSRWVGQAMRGEFYTFQVGAYAAIRPLLLTSTWTELRGAQHGAVIQVGSLRCINQPIGSVAAREGLALAEGEVLPLWFGVDVPKEVRSDSYRGAITISEVVTGAGNLQSSVEVVDIEIAVSETVAKERGDHELWRHSRLRWLDSSVGSDEAKAGTGAADECRAGASDCVALERVLGETVLVVPGARKLSLSPHGLPSSLSVGGVELLSAPAQLRLTQGGQDVRFTHEPLRIQRGPGGSLSWSARAQAVEATGFVGDQGRGSNTPAAWAVTISGNMESDGLAEMSAEVHVSPDSNTSVELSDVHSCSCR